MIKAIPFNADMTLAILDGDKTQTRRVVNPQPFRFNSVEFKDGHLIEWRHANGLWDLKRHMAPAHKAGDILWVRESGEVTGFDYCPLRVGVFYKADGFQKTILMPERLQREDGLAGLPRWASETRGIPNGIFKEAARLFIKITNVRVERLNDIRPEDVYEEGFAGSSEDLHPWDLYAEAEQAFIDTWDSLYSAKELGWEDNPWVWVYEFERTDKPADWPGN
nr:hypothetical protein [Pseudodesulfovibrio sp.]